MGSSSSRSCPRAAPGPRRPTRTRPRSSGGSSRPGRPGTPRPGSRCGTSRAPEQRAVEEEALQLAFSSDETVLSFLRRPAPPEGASRFDADVQVFAATEPRAQVLYWRLTVERRAGGLGHRGPAGGGRGRRPRPPVARARRPGARGTCRSASRTSSCGWRRARSSRPPRRSARPPSPSSVAAGSASRPRRPPSASSSASSEVRTSLDRAVGLGLHPPPPRRLPPRARDGQARARGGPGRAPGGGGARLSGAVAAQLHDRRRPPPLALVAHAERGRRGGGLPVGAEAGADPRDLLGRAGGRQPVRPRAAPADLHLPFGRPLGPLQRGRPPPGGRSGQRHHGHLRPRPARGARHAPHARAAPLPDLHPAAAPARRLRRVVGHLRRRREPAVLPGPRPGEHRRLARPPLPEEGAVHPDDPLPGPARPRPGGPGAPAGRAAHRHHPRARRGSWTGPRSCTRIAPPGTPGRRARTTPRHGSGSRRPRAGWG